LENVNLATSVKQWAFAALSSLLHGRGRNLRRGLLL